MREANTFEDPKVAEEWINAIESEQGHSRDNEIYPMLHEWSRNLSPEVILEIGAGQGICSAKLDLTNSQYIGLEPSLPLLNRAKELYAESNKKFIEGTSYEIPLPDNSVTAVFSVGVWFHIKDLDRAHTEIARIMESGGELLIINANPDMYHIWEKFFAAPRQGNMLEGSVQIPGGTLSHNIFYLHTKDEIISSLEKNNFTITSIKKFGFGKEKHADEGIWVAIRAVLK